MKDDEPEVPQNDRVAEPKLPGPGSPQQPTPESNDGINSPDVKPHIGNRVAWPFDAAVTIALLALLVSLGQFFLTTPALLNLYFRPDLVVTNMDTYTSDTRTKAFQVMNNGRASADDVEIGIISFEDDKVSVMPSFGASITQNDSVLYRTFRVVIPYLAAGENVSILVRLTDERHHKVGSMEGHITLPDGTSTSVRLVVPGITYARSRQGPGRIQATRFDVVAGGKSP